MNPKKELIANEHGYDHFVKLYKENKPLAVKFYRLSNNKPCKTFRVSFESEKGRVIQIENHKVGISRAGHLYRNKKVISKLIISTQKRSVIWKRGSAYHRVTPDYIPGIKHELRQLNVKPIEIYEVLHPGLKWMNDFDFSFKVSLTALKKHKLFSLEKLVKYKWQHIDKSFAVRMIVNQMCGVEKLEFLNMQLSVCTNPNYFFHVFEQVSERIKRDIKNGYKELMQGFASAGNHDYSTLKDTIEMAANLGYKINLKWSPKRMEKEHDKMMKEVNEVLLLGSNRKIFIDPVFTHLELPPKFTLLKTTGELAFEGKRMKHCVGSYTNNVERGTCAIYRLDFTNSSYTLELQKRVNGIIVGQLKGYRNQSAPEEIRKYVFSEVEKAVNNPEYKNKVKVIESVSNDIEHEAELPF